LKDCTGKERREKTVATAPSEEKEEIGRMMMPHHSSLICGFDLDEIYAVYKKFSSHAHERNGNNQEDDTRTGIHIRCPYRL